MRRDLFARDRIDVGRGQQALLLDAAAGGDDRLVEQIFGIRLSMFCSAPASPRALGFQPLAQSPAFRALLWSARLARLACLLPSARSGWRSGSPVSRPDRTAAQAVAQPRAVSRAAGPRRRRPALRAQNKTAGAAAQ